MKTESPFTPEATKALLESACEAVGLDPAGAQLARFGENAIYALNTAPVMARIGRSPQASRKETEVARWLEAHRFPAVRLADVEQPVELEGRAVTFWEHLETSDRPVGSAEFGALLRGLHSLPAPEGITLPPFYPMPKVEARLAAIGSALSEDERDFLAGRKQELEARFASVQFELPPGPLHADAHPGNVMRTVAGDLRLIDFEDFCWGPREWDVCVQAVRYQAFGWLSDDDYRAYVDAYGFDATKWSGFQTIKAIRELNMTTWLAQQLGQSAEVDDEVRSRIADLQDEAAPRRWRTF